jgi:hypothetical protein
MKSELVILMNGMRMVVSGSKDLLSMGNKQELGFGIFLMVIMLWKVNILMVFQQVIGVPIQKMAQ